jgi:hypothetical protein
LVHIDGKQIAGGGGGGGGQQIPIAKQNIYFSKQTLPDAGQSSANMFSSLRKKENSFLQKQNIMYIKN